MRESARLKTFVHLAAALLTALTGALVKCKGGSRG